MSAPTSLRIFWLSNLAVLLMAGACASGGTGPTDRTDTGPEMDVPVVQMDSGDDLTCDPPCSAAQSCMRGVCVDLGSDADNDGVPVEVDCDDRNPSVGRNVDRPCSSACGDGLESCTDGVWSRCSAPGSCSCTAGTPDRMIPCGFCGMRTQSCVDGNWEDAGACIGEGVCSPGAMETAGCGLGGSGTNTRFCEANCRWGEWTCTGGDECAAGEIDREMESCGGSCGQTRERSRTCVAGAWGAWSPWSACSGTGGECSPGETDMETGSCGNCDMGTRQRSRSCGADCSWGSFGAWSSCSGGGMCAPGETRGCANGDSCGVERCDGSCNYGSCEPATPSGCLRIRPGTGGPAGNNFRCCTPGGGGSGWQFCLPSCNWSTSCDPHAC